MSEWYDSQKNLSEDLQKLLQGRFDKTNFRRKVFTKEEQQKLNKLSGILDTLKRRENVYNYSNGLHVT